MDKKWFSFVFLCLALLYITRPVLLASLKGVDLSKSDLESSILCDTCIALVTTVRKLAKLHTSQELIEKAAIEYCEKSGRADDRICKQIIPEFKVVQSISFSI